MSEGLGRRNSYLEVLEEGERLCAHITATIVYMTLATSVKRDRRLNCVVTDAPVAGRAGHGMELPKT